jgi:hypothetical protein
MVDKKLEIKNKYGLTFTYPQHFCYCWQQSCFTKMLDMNEFQKLRWSKNVEGWWKSFPRLRTVTGASKCLRNSVSFYRKRSSVQGDLFASTWFQLWVYLGCYQSGCLSPHTSRTFQIIMCGWCNDSKFDLHKLMPICFWENLQMLSIAQYICYLIESSHGCKQTQGC